MTLLNTYTTLDDVKRILRSSGPRGRIRFSDSYNMLRKNLDNSGNCELSSIGISDDYSDVADYKISFSDSTTYVFTKLDSENKMDVNIGRGYTQNDFVTTDGYFSVDSTDWSGIPIQGDYIEFSTNSHISTNDGTRFVMDAEMFVDSILERNIRFSSLSESTLRFDSTAVPKTVYLATTRIASYLIHKSIFLEQAFEKSENSFSYVWLKEGLEHLSSYVEKYNLALCTSAPALGYPGSNEPVDMDNDFIFKSSQFNLLIPINFKYFDMYDEADDRGYNFINASNFSESLIADLVDL